MTEDVSASVVVLGADGLVCRPPPPDIMSLKCALGDAGFTIMYVTEFAVGLAGSMAIFDRVLGVKLADPPYGTYVCRPALPELAKHKLQLGVPRQLPRY